MLSDLLTNHPRSSISRVVKDENNLVHVCVCVCMSVWVSFLRKQSNS